MVAIFILLSSIIYNFTIMRFMSFFYKSTMIIVPKLFLISLLTLMLPLLSLIIDISGIQLFLMNLCAIAMIVFLGLKSIREINYE
jgi:hypothetical protein